ncbi:hypothetical protein INT43_009145 [Umbelopsis isabellina]|uniref:EKC/KEOPS complex subunit GON7 n=1 Tax=Mortierella isabellina TaxID=91625 RepID=A0A8H7PD54_MORIS|nr:hypothetical protein INT43_009145 [Umbelopsis isabellina]
MPELTAKYTSPNPQDSKASDYQVEYTGSRANDLKNLTFQLLIMKEQLNDHFTNLMTASGAPNGNNKADQQEQAEEEEEEEEEEDSGEKDGGMVKMADPKDRVKRVKTK